MSRKPKHFIEIMACPSGCLNGGGQLLPRGIGRELSSDMGVNEKRAFIKQVNDAYASERVQSPLENVSWLDGIYTCVLSNSFLMCAEIGLRMTRKRFAWHFIHSITT
jgi:hypothetical protein